MKAPDVSGNKSLSASQRSDSAPPALTSKTKLATARRRPPPAARRSARAAIAPVTKVTEGVRRRNAEVKKLDVSNDAAASSEQISAGASGQGLLIRKRKPAKGWFAMCESLWCAKSDWCSRADLGAKPPGAIVAKSSR